MSNLMNVIAVEGFLTSDVKLTYDEEKSTTTAKFYIKNPCQVGKNKYGNDFYVVVYGKKAESCALHLSIGKRCSVTGKVSTWLKNDKKGNALPGITIIASDVHFEDPDESIVIDK